MKWYIIDVDTSPLYWHEGDEGAALMEFDTEEDALIFLEAAEKIPFVDVAYHYPVSVERSLEGSRNYTGFIPVQNGDSVELERRA